MKFHSEAQCHAEPGADHRDVDDRKRCYLIDRARRPQRHEQCADHFGAGRQQVNSRRILALEIIEISSHGASKPKPTSGSVTSRLTRERVAPTLRPASSSSGPTCSNAL